MLDNGTKHHMVNASTIESVYHYFIIKREVYTIKNQFSDPL